MANVVSSRSDQNAIEELKSENRGGTTLHLKSPRPSNFSIPQARPQVMAREMAFEFTHVVDLARSTWL